MRPFVMVLVICVVLAVLIWAGVGQGVNACLNDCRVEHCGGLNVALDDCESEDFKPCRDACYEEHGEAR